MITTHIIFLIDSTGLGKVQTPDFDTKAHHILVFASSIALYTLQPSSFLPTPAAHAYTHSFVWLTATLNPFSFLFLPFAFAQAFPFSSDALVSPGS